jgi:hypothetical protein
MIWSFVSKPELWRRGSALVLLALAWVAFGCGSSQQTGSSASNPGKTAEDLVKPEDLYRYEGTGKAKRKVAVSRRERMKVLHEATKTLESK